MNWGNFKVDTGGNLEASNAKFTGAIRTGSSITGSTITGGSISIHKGNYYLEMGIATDHPSVSGLNAYGGINMHGNDISNIDIITLNTISPRSSDVECTANLHVSGELYAGSGSTYRGVNSTTLYVPRLDAAGNPNGYYTLQFMRGILWNAVAHNP